MLKKTCAVLMSCLVLGATPAPVWAADASGAVKTLTRTENKVTVECPQVTGGSRAADEKINRALSSQAASFASEASTLGGGKVHYDVHKSDGELISFTLVMTPNMGVEESLGMTFDRKTGDLRPLSYYYTKDQLAGLAQNGLQYLYDVDPAKLQTLPDTYYVDKDGSLIGVYHAGAVLDKSEGEIEINLSAAGMDADGNVTAAPIDHSSGSAEETPALADTADKPADAAVATGESTGTGLAKLRARIAAREKAQDEVQAKADAKAKAKAEKEARAKAEAEERLKAQQEAEAQARAEARAKARAEAKAKVEEQARKEAAQAAKTQSAKETKAAEAAAGSLTAVAKGADAAGKTAAAAAKQAVPEPKPEVQKAEQAPARPMTVKEKVAAIQAQEAKEEAAREEARMKELVAIREAAEKRAAEEKARREAEERAAEEARRAAEAAAEAERQAEAQRQAEAARAAAAALDTDVSGAGVITGTEVRMRDGAGLDSGVIGVFSQGESVQVLGSTRADGMTWYKVSRSDGSTGYVAADYCSLGSGDGSAGASGTITGTEVRMRASYSTDSEVLGYFENGETVAILDDVTSAGQRWLKVRRSDGSVGWVSADFCAQG